MRISRPIAGVAGFLVLASAALSCEAPTKVIWVRVDCRNLNISCVDDFELTFRPAGTTQIRGSSSGTWAGGDIRYGTEMREGLTVFVVTVSGNWIRDQVLTNEEFLFDLPMKNAGSAGTFELRGAWRYHGVITGEARPGGLLVLPDEDGFHSITVTRLTNDLCLSNPPDAETDAEVVEAVDPSEDQVEESVEPSEAVEENLEPEGPEAPDTVDDEAGEEGM